MAGSSFRTAKSSLTDFVDTPREVGGIGKRPRRTLSPPDGDI